MPSTFFGWVAFLWREYWPLLLKGAWTSFYMAMVGTVMGFAIGLVVAIVRTIPCTGNMSAVKRFFIRAAKFICSAYVHIFRGTPMMVQAMVVYYGLVQYAHIQLPTTIAGIVIVGINTGAYMAETMRSGITSIDVGQTEAAMSIGMTHWQTMGSIVLPQAIRNVLPAVGNSLVLNVKDSSVLNVIAVSELYLVAKSASGTYFKFFETYTIIAAMYFVITTALTKLLERLERRMDGPKQFTLVEDEAEEVAE